MYDRAYGIIETLAPLHVGATAGEESGNLNLIFRDQFTQTGIIPGSSIRGRFKADLRRLKGDEEGKTTAEKWYGKEAPSKSDSTDSATETGDSKQTTESVIKFEYASIVWLPVFCPGQPIVWVSCPRLLKRYQRIAGEHAQKNGRLLKDLTVPDVGAYSSTLKLLADKKPNKRKLFFNFGFLELGQEATLTSDWLPTDENLPAVVVEDDEMGLIHDMALYRQTRIAMEKEQKVVANFFGVEALPEGTILVFPIAIRKTKDQETWDPFDSGLKPHEVYLGGLESIGFGNCRVTVKGVKAGEQES
ncbi:MAG: type III-B CRISPR module RAMP protein Cmr4 [Elainella sp. C42_A2020_010]|nr:type III-B CRISPR module RAMP protein Cmr4 [Elainella sp. C42_A2020_010]